MQQYSEQGTPAELEILSGHILFIDPLYLENIREDYDSVVPLPSVTTSPEFVQALEERFFPYGGGSLLGYLNAGVNNSTFKLNIKSLVFNDFQDAEKEQLLIQKKITGFSTDFGAFLLMDLSNFFKLLNLTRVEDLIDASEAGELQLYIDRINSSIGNKGWAYVSNPGIGNGFDFEGSGSFFVVL